MDFGITTLLINFKIGGHFRILFFKLNSLRAGGTDQLLYDFIL